MEHDGVLKSSTCSRRSEHVRLVQKLLQNYIGKKTRVSKATVEVFLRNLEWVIRGIRPAFLPEGIALPDDALQELIKEVVPVINGASTVNELCILSLEDHKFIVSIMLCKTHLENLVTDEHLKATFVDISKTHTRPKVADYKDLSSIHEAIQCCLNALLKVPHGVGVVNIQLAEEQNTNLCTLFGCILGYPVIYYFKGSDGENCLSMVPLKVVRITAIKDSSSNQLLSFSYPLGLEEDVKLAVKTWCAEFVERDETVIVTRETVEMPYVVL